MRAAIVTIIVLLAFIAGVWSVIALSKWFAAISKSVLLTRDVSYGAFVTGLVFGVFAYMFSCGILEPTKEKKNG